MDGFRALECIHEYVYGAFFYFILFHGWCLDSQTSHMTHVLAILPHIESRP